MKSRLVRLIGCSALWALGACADKSTEVELRLYPCALTSGAPMSVSLTIQSYGADGEEIGEPLSKTFPIDDQGVFDDGFATVGFTPPAGTLTAFITVVWASGEEAVEAGYNVTVPELGQSLALETGECEGGPGTTGPSTTLDTTTAGPGTTESTGTASSTTESASTTESTSTTETTATTDSTTTSTTTETTTSTTTETTTSTTETTMGTSGGPVEGGACQGEVVVCSAGPGELGDLLKCDGSTWQNYNSYCKPSLCDGTDLPNPKPVGCVGDQGAAWNCACEATPKGECTMGMQSKCSERGGDGKLIELCIEEGDNTWYYAAVCAGCQLVDGEPQCTLG